MPFFTQFLQIDNLQKINRLKLKSVPPYSSQLPEQSTGKHFSKFPKMLRSRYLICLALAVIIPSVLLQSQTSKRNNRGKTRVPILTSVTSFIGGLTSPFFGGSESATLPYWGPKDKEGELSSEDKSIRPFQINVDEKVLDDLKARLTRETSPEGNRLTPPLEGIGFQYGTNSNFLKNVTNYWLNKYDWREREKRLNQYPQYLTRIYGIDIHFQRVGPGSSDKPARPLLLLHGWPSTFADFQKIIPLLTSPSISEINFELIIPSLPGYGFSERPHKPGMGTPQMAQLLVKLMRRLGYAKFYVHGADWGSIIATDIATMYPQYVEALHMSTCLTFHYRSIAKLLAGQLYRGRSFSPMEAGRVFPLNKYWTTMLQVTGYFHLQATQPDTIGPALANSPTGLAGYILEKFSTFTNLKWKKRRNGGILPHFNLDELLDNIMIYWVTNTITSSMRLYYEAFAENPLALSIDTLPVNVRTGCLNPPEDFFTSQNEYLLKDKFPQIVHYTKARKGGHFTAIETPEILALDLLDFYNKIETNGTRF